MNALRGHSNIQGLTDLGLLLNLIPGYLTIPTEKEPTLDSYMSIRGFKPLRPDQTSYWQNYSTSSLASSRPCGARRRRPKTTSPTTRCLNSMSQVTTFCVPSS